MTGFQAVKHIGNGEKIRRKSWKPGQYIVKGEDGKAHTETGELYKVKKEDFFVNEWEIFLDNHQPSNV